MTTPSVQAVISELSHMPQLPLVVHGLAELLAHEQKRRHEFYATITEDDKVEFINGRVVFQSPVKFRHGSVSFDLAMLLAAFVKQRHLGFVGHEKLLVALTRNDYEPDICFWRKEIADHFAPDQMRFPAPDFIVEVLSPSTEEVDRDTKFKDYEAHGVGEYWLIDPDSETVEQYALSDERYELRLKSQTGTVTSAIIPGFTIPLRAIFDADEYATTLARMVNG